MAGEVADGVHVHPLNTPTYLRETVLPSVTAGGRQPALIVPAFAAPGDTEDERRVWWEMARTQIAFYGSTPNYGFIFEQLGRPDTTPRIRERQKAGDVAGMAAVIDDDLLTHFCVAAPWDEVSSRLVERYDGVATRLVLYFAGLAASRDPSAWDRWGEIARDVIARTGRDGRHRA